jgi:hypothetical protein
MHHPLDAPTKFRPEPAGPDGRPEVDWTDNALSNSLAWGSHKITPSWCQSEEHWTSRSTDYVFTDCPCCLFFRGLAIGGAISLVLWAGIFFIARAILK